MSVPHILLDLDSTLVSAIPTEEYDIKKNKQKAEQFTFWDMDGYYIVFERPGLQEFLDWLFANYTVSVWTAASKDYALFVIDKIIRKNVSRKIDYMFFSYHCDWSNNEKNGTKNLKMLWDVFNIPGYTKDNTVILDDYVEDVYATQKGSCIISPPFEFTDKDSEKDNFLKFLQPKLEMLSNEIKNNKPIPDGHLPSVASAVDGINNEIKSQYNIKA